MDWSMECVSVVIPVYNEEAGIKDTIRGLLTYEPLNGIEIIAVNDGSTDGTERILKEFGDKIVVVNHKTNRGYGSAIISGVKKSEREIVAWYDADGQHRACDLFKVIKKICEEHLDYCIGVRGSDSYVERSRILGKMILGGVVKWASNGVETDFNSGLRAFRRDILRKYLRFMPEGFGASTVTTLLMQERNYAGSEVEITVLKRAGKSSVKQIRDGMRTLALIGNVVMLFHPMRFFGTIGVLLVLLGSIYGIMQAVIYGLGVPTLAAIVIIFGLQVLFFGVTISQISKMRKENLEEF